MAPAPIKASARKLAMQLPAILKGRRMPPGASVLSALPDGVKPKDYWSVEAVIVPGFLHIRRSICFADEWTFAIKFPKYWVKTGGFSTLWYDRIITAVDAVIAGKDPLKVFEAVHMEIYGHKGTYLTKMMR
jgi:hypothetical protein